MIQKAVILAAGAGTRMRREDSSAKQTAAQAAVAATGIKALIPVGRPFLDYVLANLADAGLRQICLVIGPHHDKLREYCGQLACRRLTVQFVVQPVPLGTANAVLAAEAFAGNDDFLVINSDNYYPTAALRSLLEADGPATIGFDRQTLIREGNSSKDRVEAFSFMESDSEGNLCGMVEKPDSAVLDGLSANAPVSMNCWRFSPAIFAACRQIDRSPRGEYEIPDAVLYSIRHPGQQYRVIPSSQPVWDLSSRRDVARLAEFVRDVEVHL